MRYEHWQAGITALNFENAIKNIPPEVVNYNPDYARALVNLISLTYQSSDLLRYSLFTSLRGDSSHSLLQGDIIMSPTGSLTITKSLILLYFQAS